MKKLILCIVCLFMCIINVNAECNDPELMKWADSVELKFQTSDGIKNANYLYYLYLDPYRDDIEITATNDLYSDVSNGAIQENGKYGIASRIHFESKTYTVNVYVKKDANVCAGEQLLRLKYTVPQYNSYSNSAYCEAYPEAELCKKMSDADDLNQEEFIDQMEEYIENKNLKDKKKDDRSIFEIIVCDYLIWLLIPALIIGIIYGNKIKKVRRAKDEK